jgi:hypothetical protein
MESYVTGALGGEVGEKPGWPHSDDVGRVDEGGMGARVEQPVKRVSQILLLRIFLLY